MKILVLDDDKGFLETVELMLASGGHEVDTTTNAEHAASEGQRNDYDVVLVDYKMPNKDGLWFMKNANLPLKTKALLVTAYINRDIVNQMFQLGASGYLIKPFDQNDRIVDNDAGEDNASYEHDSAYWDSGEIEDVNNADKCQWDRKDDNKRIDKRFELGGHHRIYKEYCKDQC